MNPSNENARWSFSTDALILIMCVGAANITFFLLAARNGNPAYLDFSGLYTAGGLVIEGHSASMFNPQTQLEFQHRVLGRPGLLPFMHLPYESVLFVPLAFLPMTLALWIWRVVSVCMLICSTRFLADIFNVVRLHVFLLAVGFFPVVVTLYQGQDSILILLLFSSSLMFLCREKDRPSGFLIAAAMVKPQLILPLAAILIWQRGHRFLQGFLGGTAAVLLISLAIAGLRGLREMAALWQTAASGSGRLASSEASAMPNIRGIVWTLGLGANTLLLTAILSALLFLAIAWRLRQQRSPEVLFPPLIAATLLLSVHLYAHDLVLLIIPMLALFVTNQKVTSICAAMCLCMLFFLLLGHFGLFGFVTCSVLLVTLKYCNATSQASHVVLLPGG